ncbi:hypothetical protein PR202_gb08026 [Eleusine coracana subsp. coracana]|uniref:MATH domain-containing protein n=1 Tax=Eleusine coracana subsp. coracana TaxID=191504 RepID=A0AAV5EEP8_ELECO|nr:hypothetical protein PR202_gb08026 [Eleusine coracana subsp. coracana]
MKWRALIRGKDRATLDEVGEKILLHMGALKPIAAARRRRSPLPRRSEETEAAMAPTSGSGSRKPSRSASTIVADNAGGYHDFKIDGYSRIENLPTGDFVKSGPFTVGGHCWRIALYPNGL